MNISSKRQIPVVREAQGLAEWRKTLVAHDQRPLIGFVPTMGVLHEGHLSLIREAKQCAQYVVVSLFVNPTQFNHLKDFETYPRDETGDLLVAMQAGADLIFIPTPEIIYPNGAETWVNVNSLGDHLCGATRPNHFQGVCTVVTALFNLVQCQLAVFGEKDYQQLAIIRRMTRDLHLPVQIIGMPTYREVNGLAMSSRNERLSVHARSKAASIYKGLCVAQSLWREGVRQLTSLEAVVRQALPDVAVVDYLSFCDPHTLEPLEALNEHETILLAIACFIEEIRLIDNVILGRSI